MTPIALPPAPAGPNPLADSATLFAQASGTAPRGGGEALTGFTGWVVSVMEALGPVGVGLMVALENLFPPIPSEIILPLAGFTASQGTMNLYAAIVLATLGSVIGALALYYVGRAFGLDRLRRWAAKLPLVDIEDIDKTVAWFERHGPKAVFFGRMIPIFRSLISIPAGVEKMRLMQFTVLTTAGSLIWNSIFVVAGFYLGENWHIVEQYAGWFQRIVIVVVAVAVVWWIVNRIRRNRREKVLAAELEATEPEATKPEATNPGATNTEATEPEDGTRGGRGPAGA